MIITIDGSVGTGKSTVAKHLAQALGFIYFDTGAMYRALTYGILKNGIDEEDPQQLAAYLKEFKFNVRTIRDDKRYFIDHEDVTDQIRSLQVTSYVSKIAAIPMVREKLVTIQRELANGVNAIFEGRDMGTVVFPDAPVQIFLTANPRICAKRRYEEMIANNPELAQTLDVETVLENIMKRDALDSSREISPLCQPPKAAVIDTSNLTVEDVVFKILEYKDQLKIDHT